MEETLNAGEETQEAKKGQFLNFLQQLYYLCVIITFAAMIIKLFVGGWGYIFGVFLALLFFGVPLGITKAIHEKIFDKL